MNIPKIMSLLLISLLASITQLPIFSMDVFKASSSNDATYYEARITSAQKRAHDIELATEQQIAYDSSLTQRDKNLLRDISKKVIEAIFEITQQPRQELPTVIKQTNMLEPIIAEHIINDGVL